MSPDKQQQFDTTELLGDICYVNQTIEDEIKRVNNELRHLISESNPAKDTVDSIIGEVSNQLGQLLVKVNLTEQATRSIRLEQKRESTATAATSEINEDGLQFGVGQLVRNKNLLPIETNGNGISYTWSGSNPETQFTFTLDRSKSLGMQIRMFALIKPEYSKLLKVMIDGKHIKHYFYIDGEHYVVSCNLPSSNETCQTHIRIILPATHSPKELGTSTDDRKLGVAINEIRFGKPKTRFAHLLKRLNLKT